MIWIVMGVAGSGKSTIGRLLADSLGVTFHDADDFHPPENKAKMGAGIPLTDEDRWPWLRAMAAAMPAWEAAGGAVLACSALKESYRQVLRDGAPGAVRFAFLDGPREELERRLRVRQGHFMGPKMLESQLATLEAPKDAVRLDIRLKPREIVSRIRRTKV